MKTSDNGKTMGEIYEGIREAERNNGDILSLMLAYEDGQLTRREEIVFFQQIINNGLVWKLQGSYGHKAESLIMAGKCHLPRKD